MQMLGVLLALPLIAACQADVTVDVAVDEDGSGLVTTELVLDAEAAAALLDLGDDGLRLDDLVQTGWALEPPVAGDDGSVTARVSKEFGTPLQFSELMAELSGTSGLFTDFQLTRERSFARVDYGLTGSVTPSGFNGFSDPALDTALQQTIDQLAATYASSGSDVDVAVVVRLPGESDDERSNGTVDLEAEGRGSVRAWRTSLAGAAPIPLASHSSTQKVAALVWRGVAVVAAVLAVLLLFGHLLRLLRPERRRSGRSGRSGSRPVTPPPMHTPKQARPRSTTPKAVPDTVGATKRSAAVEGLGGFMAPRMVALDGMGVLYREGDDIARILVPFVREQGSDAPVDDIVARARLLSLGRITPGEFWPAVGVTGDPDALDDEYLARFALSPGVTRFLRSMRSQGVQVACVTNDCTAWANKLRVRHSLDGLIDPWVVSGAVGVRKPDAPIYEVLRRVTQLDPIEILIVDDKLDNLDAARSLGFSTAWFSLGATTETSRGHAVLRSFDVTVPE